MGPCSVRTWRRFVSKYGRKYDFLQDCYSFADKDDAHPTKNELLPISWTEFGLAVGVELGVTPVSRIGIRGDRSVRVATSVAATRSEMMQKECEHNGVKFGETALSAAPAALNEILTEGYSADLGYGDVAVCLSAPPEIKSAVGAASGLASPFIASQAAAALSEGEKSSRLAEAVAARQSNGTGSKPWSK